MIFHHRPLLHVTPPTPFDAPERRAYSKGCGLTDYFLPISDFHHDIRSTFNKLVHLTRDLMHLSHLGPDIPTRLG